MVSEKKQTKKIKERWSKEKVILTGVGCLLVLFTILSATALFDNPGQTIVEETPFYKIYQNGMGEKTLSMDWTPLSNIALIPNVTGFRGIEYDYTGQDGLMFIYVDSNISNPSGIALNVNNSEFTYRALSMSWNHGNGTVDLLQMSNGGQNESTANLVRFNDTFGPGVHVEYEYNPYALKENIKIPNATSIYWPDYNMTNRTLEFAFRMDRMSNMSILVDGVIWNQTSRVETSRDIIIYDENNNTFARIDRPTLEGSAGGFEWGTLILQNQSDKFDIIISISEKSLNGALVYPLTLDPNFALDGTSGALDGNFTFENVEIINGATLYVGGQNKSTRITATNFFLDASSTINGEGRGWNGANAVVGQSDGLDGNGPNKGGKGLFTATASAGCGAGHVNNGAQNSAGDCTAGVGTYSSSDTTDKPGSSGASGAAPAGSNSPSSPPAAASLYIEAFNLTLLGTVELDGSPGTNAGYTSCVSGSLGTGSGASSAGTLMLNGSYIDTTGLTVNIRGQQGGGARVADGIAGSSAGGIFSVWYGEWLNVSLTVNKAGGTPRSQCSYTATGSGGGGETYTQNAGTWSSQHGPVIVDANITTNNVTAGSTYDIYAITNDTDADTFLYANFNLVAPNGTAVLTEQNGTYVILSNGTTQEEPSSWNWTSPSFLIHQVTSSLGTWTWNVTTQDNTSKVSGVYSGTFDLIDRYNPLISGMPNGTESSLSVTINVNTTDDIEVSPGESCRYNVTRGASVEIANTYVACNQATNFTVSSDTTTYQLGYLVNDTSNKQTEAVSTFTVNTASTPSSPAPSGGSAGGGSSFVPAPQSFTIIRGAETGDLITPTYFYFSFTGDEMIRVLFKKTDRPVEECTLLNYRNFTSDVLSCVKNPDDRSGFNIVTTYKGSSTRLVTPYGAVYQIQDDTGEVPEYNVQPNVWDISFILIPFDEPSDSDALKILGRYVVSKNAAGQVTGVRGFWPITIISLVSLGLFIWFVRRQSFKKTASNLEKNLKLFQLRDRNLRLRRR